MTIYIIIGVALLAMPGIIWQMSPYEREFRRLRRQRDNLRRSRGVR